MFVSEKAFILQPGEAVVAIHLFPVLELGLIGRQQTRLEAFAAHIARQRVRSWLEGGFGIPGSARTFAYRVRVE